MKGAIMIARFRSIKIFIHWTFFLLIAWVAFNAYMLKKDAGFVLNEVLFIFSVFACVVLHEMGHAMMAARYGIVTRDIILLPIGGVARLEKMPDEPRQELFVAIAGPLVNVLIAAVLLVVILLGKGFPLAYDMEKFQENSFVMNLIVVNLSLILFNMIPAFPMDGGRILRSLLAMKMDRTKATAIASKLGQLIAVFFVIAGLMFNPFLILIGVFVFLGAQAEERIVSARSALHGVRVGDVAIRDYIMLSDSDTVGKAGDALIKGHGTEFLVSSEGGGIGVLGRDELLRGFSMYGAEGLVSEIARMGVAPVEENDDLEKIWETMQSQGLPALPVTSGGSISGILTAENVREYVLIRLSGGHPVGNQLKKTR